MKHRSSPDYATQERRKVAVLDPAFGVTGAHRSSAHAARLLAKSADTILILPTRTTIDKSSAHDFSSVYKVPIVKIRRSLTDVILYGPMLVFSAFKILQILRVERCTRLVINDYHLLHGAILRILGYKGLILTWVRTDPKKAPRPLGAIWTKSTYFASNWVVANSDFVENRLPRSRKLIRVYPPVPAERSRGSKAEDRYEISYVANYTSGKGQELAIKAFARLAHSFPTVTLHFYGGDLGRPRNIAYRLMLEELARSSGASGQIFFHGFAADVGSILGRSIMALNFSGSEGFSRTCLEASFAGVPIIATRCGGPEEIVQHGTTGFLIPIDDEEAASAAIFKLLSNRELAAKMGKAGEHYVREKFDPKRFTTIYLRLLFGEKEYSGERVHGGGGAPAAADQVNEGSPRIRCAAKTGTKKAPARPHFGDSA